MNAIDFQNGFVMGLCANGRTLKELETSKKSDTIYGIWSENLHTSYHEEIGLFVAECRKIEAISSIKNGVYLLADYLEDQIYEVFVVSNPEEGLMITKDPRSEDYWGIAPYNDKYYFFTSDQTEEKDYSILLFRKTSDVEDYVFYSEDDHNQPITSVVLTNSFSPNKPVILTIEIEGEVFFKKEITFFEGFENYLLYYQWGGDNPVPYLGEAIKQQKIIFIELLQNKDNQTFVKKVISGKPKFPTENFNYFVWGNKTLFPLPD